MLKKWTVGAALLTTSLVSQASVISFDTSITGADMAGMEVVATFADGSTESVIWGAIGVTPGNTGNAVVDAEGLSGGVFGTGWSLVQQGYSLGNYNNGNAYGAWNFSDSVGLTQLQINSNGSDIVFDTQYIPDLASDANGSGQGRAAMGFQGNVLYNGFTASYTDQVFQEIYSSLILTLDNPGDDFSFWADTDRMNEDSSGDVVYVVDEVADYQPGDTVPADQVDGNGTAEVVVDQDTGDVEVQLAVADPDSNDPVIFTNLISTPNQSFFLNFDFYFGTSTGLLEVLLNDVLLGSYNAADYTNEVPVSIFIDDSSFFGLTDIALDFALYPGSPASINLDNINVSYSTPVSEPTTLGTIALSLVALAGIRRRKSK